MVADARALTGWNKVDYVGNVSREVDPLDPIAIAQAIDYLVTNQDDALRMGENGRRVVVEKYSWANEEKKLFAFYDKLLGEQSQ